MTRRIFPINDWAPAQEAMLAEPSESSAMGATAHNNEAGSASLTNEPRLRSKSSSLPWRRPKSLMFGHDHHHLFRQFNDLAIDDTEEEAQEPSPGPGQAQEQQHEHHDNNHHHHHHLHAPAALKGIIRRASMSLKGFVHRRPSVAAEEIIDEQDTHVARPTTAHSTWYKLRNATSRHSRASGLDLIYEPGHTYHRRTRSHHFPIPGFGDEPPVIPTNSGAAAKASAALQNEYFARHSKFLFPTASEDNDGESGIGIAATIPVITTEEVMIESSAISKVDFILNLPTELGIQVLANLDAAALIKASQVSKPWNRIIQNQHIWRESCLREMTKTYATSAPVAPGTGLGIPQVSPKNDWKDIYRVKQELNHRWKAGQARPVYLNGHQDSIYCLQFDE